MTDDELSIGEAAELLGMSREHLADLADKGEIPCRRHPVTRNRIFQVADIEARGRFRRAAPTGELTAPPQRTGMRQLNIPPSVDPDVLLFGRPR